MDYFRSRMNPLTRVIGLGDAMYSLVHNDVQGHPRFQDNMKWLYSTMNVVRSLCLSLLCFYHFVDYCLCGLLSLCITVFVYHCLCVSLSLCITVCITVFVYRLVYRFVCHFVFPSSLFLFSMCLLHRPYLIFHSHIHIL